MTWSKRRWPGYCGMFEGLYGLSCVENQVLAFLRQQEVDVAPLYYNSAVPLKELFFFMVIQGGSPVCFDRVQRIQDDLRTRGILAFEKREQELPAWLHILSEQTEREAVLILVTPEFTKSVLMARGFRDDHYVRLLRRGTGWVVFNDIPDKSVTLTDAELREAYAGDGFCLSLCRGMDREDRLRFWNSRIFKPESHVDFWFYEQDLDGVPDVGRRLRDMIGIYKQLRYRMAAFYENYGLDMAFLWEKEPEMERIYALTEYYHLKRSVPSSQFYILLQEIARMDNSLMAQLRNRLGG